MTKVRVAHEDGNLYFGQPIKMREDLSALTTLIASIDEPILFFNIGTDRSTGDSYGPLIGTLLDERNAKRYGCVVMGTVEDSINAVNLEDKINEAKRKYGKYVCIASDACLGRIESIGTTTVAKGMITPGAGVDKMLPPVGDYALTAVVNVGGFMNFFVLQNTPLGVVYPLARRAADAIIAGLKLRQKRLSENRRRAKEPKVTVRAS